MNHWTASSYVHHPERAYRNEHSTQHHSALALAFSTTAELTIRGGGKPYSNLALDADRENGPAARSFAADAHDRIMVRINRSYRIQVCLWHEAAPNGELPSDHQRRHRPDAETVQKAPSQFIIARVLRPQALRNTSVARRQAAKLCYRFDPLTPFRALREPDRRRRDEERLSRSEQRTAYKPKYHLTGKAPYRFESCFPMQGVSAEPVNSKPAQGLGNLGPTVRIRD